MADIARLAGVSTSTVSRALTDSPQISERVKRRIKSIALQYNYQTHLGARNLRLKKEQRGSDCAAHRGERCRDVCQPLCA
ncbi:MAG: LacI family DNA-binding transcriptional regulator [Chloroflexi bacterium]|nr:LacI family DNA-binding transcriptional regulator [Chloroflexota bacterium]